MKQKLTQILIIVTLTQFSVMAQEPTRYMEPPKELKDIIEAPSFPVLRINPTKTFVVLAYPQEMPDISDLAKPELKLAGVRIDPDNYGESRARFYDKLILKKIESKEEFPVSDLPENGNIKQFRWSPNGEKLAIVVYQDSTIELWVTDVATGKSKLWAKNLHDALVSSPVEWSPIGNSIYFASRVLYREPFHQQSKLPEGPSVQETSGKSALVRTYQDLLKDLDDERAFEHYATSCIMMVKENEEPTMIGNPGIITSFEVSPSGEYILVEQIMRPFSYVVPYYRFPTWVEIWTSEGKLFKKLAETPLAEEIPQGFSAVRTGPRNFQWRADAPATVVWVEAQDEGDPKKIAEIRDLLYKLDAPFKDKPTPFLSLNLRYAGITWGWDQLAVVYERWYDGRRSVTSFFNPSNIEEPKEVIWDRSWQDLYSDPGRFLIETNEQGFNVLLTDDKKNKLFLSGQGASPKGSFPFFDEFEISTQKPKRIWQCEDQYYEYLVSVLNIKENKILTSRESEADQPNYFIRDTKKKKIAAFTQFPHPYPQLKDVQKELVKYTREDGIELSATLYLPAGYKKGSKKLPVLMWAYPEEFSDPKLANQVKDSPYRFIRPTRLSPVMWVARGYVVLDRIGMPVVKKDTLEPNDTFVEQIVTNAKAAVDFLVDQNIADPSRIAIGGHSYGAFMTANLLAHSNLFAAGIARSGAYNRTLTPFGFQGEERTYWEAPEVYNRMSPFMHADKLKTPILFIHGEDDNNSGTFPMQTERMYSAIKGHGGTARMVMLPFESHGYQSRQSVLHTAWEMDTWLEKWLKGKKTK
ncbi:MAG TPA: prolyl oligopeptidase family serine peptidase [Tenuifilaceae bacterium]|nr:prolyl oligopeptidase family serine peptidase [Tenuifilaceae bacterium]